METREEFETVVLRTLLVGLVAVVMATPSSVMAQPTNLSNLTEIVNFVQSERERKLPSGRPLTNEVFQEIGQATSNQFAAGFSVGQDKVAYCAELLLPTIQANNADKVEDLPKEEQAAAKAIFDLMNAFPAQNYSPEQDVFSPLMALILMDTLGVLRSISFPAHLEYSVAKVGLFRDFSEGMGFYASQIAETDCDDPALMQHVSLYQSEREAFSILVSERLEASIAALRQ